MIGPYLSQGRVIRLPDQARSPNQARHPELAEDTLRTGQKPEYKGPSCRARSGVSISCYIFDSGGKRCGCQNVAAVPTGRYVDNNCSKKCKDGNALLSFRVTM